MVAATGQHLEIKVVLSSKRWEAWVARVAKHGAPEVKQGLVLKKKINWFEFLDFFQQKMVEFSFWVPET